MDLRQLGPRAHVFDQQGNNFGFAHLPAPVEPGDLLALEQRPALRVAAVIQVTRRAPSTCSSRLSGAAR